MNRLTDISRNEQRILVRLRRRLFWRIVQTMTLSSLAVVLPITLLLWWSGACTGVQALRWGGMLLASSGLISLMGARVISQRGAPAIGGFEETLEQVAAGRYAPELPRESRETFAELAGAFDEMTRHVRSSSWEMSQDRNRLQTIINSMIEGVVAVDPEQRILLLNPAVCQQFELKETGSLGRPLWEVLRNAQIQDWVNQALELQKRTGGELKLRTAVPRTLMVSVSPFPLERAANVSSPGGAVLVIGDVTDLRRLESIRQEFVANASHELKTPLAAIQGCVETLLNGAANDPTARTRFLELIDEQSSRLNALVQDLLTLARIETDAAPPPRVPIDPLAIARASLERNRPAAHKKDLQLELVALEHSQPISGDEESLEVILDNLLDNAIKYTNPGGRVILRCAYVDACCVLEVEDNGIGIPLPQQGRIFERFYRVDRHRSRDQGGTGLGLSIVKHLVQSLGGKVSLESQLNQGSKFRVQIPLTEKPA